MIIDVVEMQDANGTVVQITKPVASRPSRSFRSFPERPLAPLAEKPTTVVVVEPKSSTGTRFRSASNDSAAKAVVVVALMVSESNRVENYFMRS